MDRCSQKKRYENQLKKDRGNEHWLTERRAGCFLGEEWLRQVDYFIYLVVNINQENEQIKEIKNGMSKYSKTCSCSIPC